MFLTSQCEIADNMQTVSATCGPTWYDANHNLGHEANESLNLQNVEAPTLSRIDAFGGLTVGIAVSVATANSLVASATKSPSTIFC